MNFKDVDGVKESHIIRQRLSALINSSCENVKLNFSTKILMQVNQGGIELLLRKICFRAERKVVRCDII